MSRPKLPVPKEKRCTKCDKIKPVAQFHKQSQRYGHGYRSRCIPCTNEDQLAQYYRRSTKTLSQDEVYDAWVNKEDGFEWL